ncbi:M24 family metallopeptidase [Ureibacillus sp. FSL W8-0352]|uniref:M24 family metallopeptidase n=1 Tax=Ureibacillus sp. FSL W8-0352 TaxID=2954596 RepID=UPI0030F51E07
MYFQKRRENLLNSLRKIGIHNILVQDLDNIFYLTGFLAAVHSRPFGLVLGQEKCVLIVPATSAESAKKETNNIDIAIYYEHPVDSEECLSFHDCLALIVEQVADEKLIGVEENKLSLSDLKLLKEIGFDVQNISNYLIKMRSIKDTKELKEIRLSAKYVDLMNKKTLDITHPGITEIELEQEGAFYLRKEVLQNLSDASLSTFIMTTSGTDRTVMPHTNSSNRKIQLGDAVILCRQVAINGYRAQCDRMVFVGNPSKEMIKYYSIVLEAHSEALNVIRSGISAAEVDQAIRKVFKKADVDEYFVHRSGSGLGISMGEAPYLRFDSQETLAENMVLVVQPAIYIPGVGGFRCSDTVIVQKEGCELITKHPRDIQLLTVS